MPAWTFYSVFLGTIISVAGLTRIAIAAHDIEAPKALSDLVVAEEALLVRFRNILLVCGVLFAISLFGFIVPRLTHGLFVIIFGILMIGGELLAAVIPARGKTFLLHIVLAHTMAVGMFGLGVSFCIALAGRFATVETILTVSMAACAMLTLANKKYYLTYELAFISLSHVSVVVAALALK